MKMNNFFWSVPPRCLFSKTSLASISMSSDHRDRSTISFFFHLNNQTSLHCWLYEVNTRDFIFQGIQQWLVIILVNWINACFHLKVLYRLLKAKKCLRNQGQFKWVTRKTRHHVFIEELPKRNLMSKVAELFRRPMLKIFFYSGDNQLFKNHRE